jgi:flagellar assembly protein FliH
MTSSPDLPSRLVRGAAAADLPAAPLEGLLDPLQRSGLDELATAARQDARAEGYAVGWAQGRRAAEEAAQREAAIAAAERAEFAARSQASLVSALRALTAAADALEGRAVAPAAELSAAVVATSFELAQALIGRELTLATEPGIDAIRRALPLAPENRPVTARLHPDDASAARSALPTANLGREVLIVADPSIEPGGAVVDCDATRVDAQLGPALDRVREVLGL